MENQCCDEEWRPVENFEGIYEVSNKGRVRSLDRKVYNYWKTGRILKPHDNGHSYLNVGLRKEGYKEKHAYIHILVAKAFIPNPNNYAEVNHKDFDKTNNCVENLEWVSRKQNHAHYRASSYCKRNEMKREKKFASKTMQRIADNKDQIIQMYEQGYKVVDICKTMNLGRDFVYGVLRLFDVMGKPAREFIK